MNNTSESPEWLKGFKATSERGNPAWQKGGQSPNPSGRPKGIVDKRTKVTQALANDAPAIARVVIDAALAGDLQAASLVLSRVAPPLKTHAERVEFTLTTDANLAEQAKQILQAIAEGKVDPDTGKSLIGCIHSVSGICAVEDLEARLIALEEQSR